MANTMKRIREDIQTLTNEDKEELLRELLIELDGPADDDVERAWLAEAHRRLNELDDGTVKPIPAEEVFERLRSRVAE